jgi:ATP-dependent Clp protease adapter protein ClpS
MPVNLTPTPTIGALPADHEAVASPANGLVWMANNAHVVGEVVVAILAQFEQFNQQSAMDVMLRVHNSPQGSRVVFFHGSMTHCTPIATALRGVGVTAQAVEEGE